tara:strand:+ start:102 stop:1514 length:1413 start_codon:yes stop_codon:yes gene_type:complete
MKADSLRRKYMCGIIGVLGKQDVADHLVGALKRLEYRGYDSAGIATLSNNGVIERRRAAGKLSNLEAVLKENPVSGHSGIGHTRWATHGAPSAENAHPHATEAVAVVHNGIIENYQDIKASLDPQKHSYKSETDSEVIVHLVTQLLEDGLSPKEAAFEALDRLKGAYAVALLFRGEEDLLIGARQGPPLAFGLGEDEMYLASDSYALAPLTKKICFLEDGDRVVLSRTSYETFNVQGETVERPIRITAQSGAAMGKGAYKHFMLKEIYEQPAVIGDTLNSFINPATNDIHFPDEIVKALKAAPRLTLIGCGGSFYASLLAKYWFEQIAGIPCEVDIASEYRYRTPPLPKGGVCIFTSQSGETVDTLEALRYCKSQGQTIISIVNTIESTIERESDHVLKTLAGPEIAVASTKATTTQYTTFACLALAAAKGHVPDNEYDAMAEALRHLPATTRAVLSYDDEIKAISRDIA